MSVSDDRKGVLMTGTMMMVSALYGTDEDVSIAKKCDGPSKILMSNKYFDQAQKLLESFRKLLLDEVK